MFLNELRVGERFRFLTGSATAWYVYRGNCWYGSIGGYDGGPWHADGLRPVVSPDHETSNQWGEHLQHCADNGCPC